MTARTLAAAALAATLAGIAAPAFAEEPPKSIKWHTFDKWAILSDPSFGNGCYMHTNYNAGASLRFGFDHSDPAKVSAYVELFRTDGAWASLKQGQQYQVMVAFDDMRPAVWTGLAVAMANGTPALIIPFTNPDIFTTAARASSIHISYQGHAVIDGFLYGSTQALDELLACDRAITGASAPAPAPRAPTPDPFRATTPAKPADPFRPA